MASSSSTEQFPVDALTYLRSKTQVDLDCLDVQFAKTLGPFSDCTSNQWEAYLQLGRSENAATLKQSVALSRQLHTDFPSVTVEELAVEIAMVSLGLGIIPHITGAIHLMANPTYSYNTAKVVENGQRLARLCRIIDPSFDLSRLIVKVPATWEGLQACKKLKIANVKTLATTLFTMEQAILAGEVGCISVSPFAYELRAHSDSSYHDPDPTFDLFVRIQKYYVQHSIPTKVKACAFLTADEALEMAGVDALTMPPEMIEELAARKDFSTNKWEARSRFLVSDDNSNSNGIHSSNANANADREEMTFVNDKAKFLELFSQNARGKAKTDDSIAVFCDFQALAEAVVRDSKSTN